METLLQQRYDDMAQGLIERVDAVIEDSIVVLRQQQEQPVSAP